MTHHNPVAKKLREKKFQQKIVKNKKGKGSYKRNKRIRALIIFLSQDTIK